MVLNEVGQILKLKTLVILMSILVQTSGFIVGKPIRPEVPLKYV